MKADVRYDPKKRTWCVELDDREARLAAKKAQLPGHVLDGKEVVYPMTPGDEQEAIRIADNIRKQRIAT